MKNHLDLFRNSWCNFNRTICCGVNWQLELGGKNGDLRCTSVIFQTMDIAGNVEIEASEES
jgi:hypothetical protein